MELSKRLYAVAGLVTEGASVADIGTDHGYIPIFLARRNPGIRLIAMDVNRGPLEKAREHIQAEGLEHRIQLRLSDGLAALSPGEVHTVITAGMGGALMIRIMEDCPETAASVKEWILQPQSEIAKVRKYLETEGYTIVREDMVEEDGKYYPMMKVIHSREEKPYSSIELLYGRRLLNERHPVLYRYLRKEQTVRQCILEQLREAASPGAKERQKTILKELEEVRTALQLYEKE